jgi:hypothetical protein
METIFSVGHDKLLIFEDYDLGKRISIVVPLPFSLVDIELASHFPNRIFA